MTGQNPGLRGGFPGLIHLGSRKLYFQQRNAGMFFFENGPNSSVRIHKNARLRSDTEPSQLRVMLIK